ncbi:hypothetical protein ABT026_09570 [Streptomyces sp. NPDC002734]|uniref:hypothetical protein n=1 Tax=Streptomyces sp. NPDC002734 TaxID=3154426 RepID=UPI00331F987C
MACAVVPWFVGEPLLLRLTTALAAAVGVAAAVTLRRWDASAGLNVAELKRARASAEWQHEERVAELEADLEEGRELRMKLEHRLRSKRAELAALRNEHASLLRRYATAETERASALEGRRLLELEAADPVPQLPPARETRALGPAPAPEPVRPFSPAGSGLFRQAVEALDSLEALQAAAGAEETGLEPGVEAEVAVEGLVEVELDAGVDSDAGAGAGAGAGSAVDGVAAVEENVEGTERVGEAPGGHDAGAGADGSDSVVAERGTSGVTGTDLTAETAEASPAEGGEADADGSEDVVTARGAAGARDPHAPERSVHPHGAASAAQAEVTPDPTDPHRDADQDGEAAPGAGVPAVAGAGGAEEPEARGAEGVVPGEGVASGEPAGTGSTTAKPVRPSGGHFTVPTAVAVPPEAPAPRRPAAEGSFDFFGTQRTDHGAEGDTDRTAGDDRQRPAPAPQPTPAPQAPHSPQPAPAPQHPGSAPSPRSPQAVQPPQASPAASGPEPQPRPQPLIRSQQTAHRADVGRVIDVDGQDDDLHAAS